MAINSISTISAIGGATKTIADKIKQTTTPAATSPSPTAGDGSWIGEGTGNQSNWFNWEKAERSRLKALDKANARQKKNIAREYELGKSALAGQAATSRRQLAEYLAQTGRLSSGAAAQAQLTTGGQLMSGLATLDASRQQSLAELERQQDDARAQIMAEAAARQQAMAEQAYNRDVDAIQSGAYQQDIQAEINRRTAINPNDPTIPILQAQRNQKLAGIAESEAAARQQDFENQLALMRIRKSSGGGGGDGSGSGSNTATAPQLFEFKKRADGGLTNISVTTKDSLNALAQDIQSYLSAGDYQSADQLFIRYKPNIEAELGAEGVAKFKALLQNARYYLVK